jgi:hypothetical protein
MLCWPSGSATVNPVRVSRDSRPALLVPAARRDVLEGLRAVLGDARMRLLTGIYGMNMLVQGMVDVLIVIAALELLHLGSGGPGWLSVGVSARTVAVRGTSRNRAISSKNPPGPCSATRRPSAITWTLLPATTKKPWADLRRP